ncbi:MAG TPA: hypothetical protein VF608_13555 [Thermoanaerobaculia bacterium]
MSRVERTETTNARNSESRQSQRGRNTPAPQSDPNPGHTPSKAEGEVSDVEEALRRQDE